MAGMLDNRGLSPYLGVLHFLSQKRPFMRYISSFPSSFSSSLGWLHQDRLQGWRWPSRGPHECRCSHEQEGLQGVSRLLMVLSSCWNTPPTGCTQGSRSSFFLSLNSHFFLSFQALSHLVMSLRLVRGWKRGSRGTKGCWKGAEMGGEWGRKHGLPLGFG